MSHLGLFLTFICNNFLLLLVIIASLLLRIGTSQSIFSLSQTRKVFFRWSRSSFADVMNLPIFFGTPSPKGLNLSPCCRHRAIRGGFICLKSNHSMKLSFFCLIDLILHLSAGRISVSIIQSEKQTLPGIFNGTGSGFSVQVSGWPK